jgi:hypothetical protein
LTSCCHCTVDAADPEHAVDEKERAIAAAAESEGSWWCEGWTRRASGRHAAAARGLAMARTRIEYSSVDRVYGTGRRASRVDFDWTSPWRGSIWRSPTNSERFVDPAVRSLVALSERGASAHTHSASGLQATMTSGCTAMLHRRAFAFRTRLFAAALQL